MRSHFTVAVYASQWESVANLRGVHFRDMPASGFVARHASLQPLASRDFRLLFFGSLTVWLAMPLQFITQIFWIQDTFPDREVLYVGLMSASRGLAMLSFGLIGGAFADRYERRRVILVSQCVALAVNGGIALLMLTMPVGDATFYGILVLTFASAAVLAVDMPARNASLPSVVPAAHLPGAVSLGMMTMQITPPLTLPVAGLLNQNFDAAYIFTGSLAIWLVILPLANALRYRSTGGAAALGGMFANISSGLRYSRADRIIFGAVGLVVALQVIGMPGAGTLGPVWITSVLGLSEAQFGLVAMVWGLGAVTASLVFTRYPGQAMRGSTICAAAIAFGCGAIVFGHAQWVPLTIVANFVLGFSLAATMLSGTAIAQVVVSEDMRGRVMGLFPLAIGMAMLNAAPVSALAELTSLEFVMPLAGWLTLTAIVVIVFTQPALRHFRPGAVRDVDLALVAAVPVPVSD